MIQQESVNSNVSVPVCKERYCNGILKIEFDPDNFSINYECEKNKEHKGKNIVYEAFDKYYIKTKKINKCFKCSNILENERYYRCIQCQNNYCYNCFMYDIHVKNDKKNLRMYNNLCHLHYNKKIYYCLSCQKYFCFSCNDDNNCIGSNNHNVINILELFPTKKDIDSQIIF